MPLQLNSAQQQAILHNDGALLVLAGAGSGKTRVITEKIAHLIHQAKVRARNITALTFTNKAAKEMNERIRSRLEPSECRGIIISTFHTLGLRIIRSEINHLELNLNFSIYDSHDSLHLIQSIVEQDYGNLDKFEQENIAQHARQLISNWKNNYILAENVNDDPDDIAYARIYQYYQKLLRIYNAVDFDDLIMLPLELFKRHPLIREKWQQRIQYLLVDEYQDTNTAQYELIKTICLQDNHRTQLTVVGDDDQSIYCWRGARPENLSLLQQDFPALKVVKLEQNYRSTQTILKAANAVILNNPHTFVKKLWSDHDSEDLIEFYRAKDEKDEINFVVSSLIKLRYKFGYSYADMAILYRNNYQSRAFEKKLREQQIPYQISGGTSFFANREIKDIMAYLKLIINPQDDIALLRIINTPKRKIGTALIEKLSAYREKVQLSLFETAKSKGFLNHLAAHEAKRFDHFCTWMETLIQLAEQQSISQALAQLIEDSQYIEWLYASSSSENKAKRKIDNVEDLANWIERMENDSVEQNNIENSQQELMNKLVLMDILEKNEQKDQAESVSLMTLHSAKGLEFPVVHMVGVEEELLPHINSIEMDNIEEERRLFYVGLTRAKRKIFLSMATQRNRYNGECQSCLVSRFIEEIPSEYIHIINPENSSEEEQQQRVLDAIADMRALLDNKKNDSQKDV